MNHKQTLKKVMETTIFDATWRTDSDPKPEDQGQGYSEDVLIDLDGNRKDFRVGWYDHDDGEWRLHDKNSEQYIDREHMKWTRLPLAANDRG